ncbi:hypothetical protein J1N35_025333 [Gossypium stocksii]|uniref:Uncharacterized protein n=1 Tax=Gossypium stocksii TaxID=47602 RepID=A0A9D3ZW39_9ROSI|nr:hypothetical protein J1N35_025333 [Gossypium stocksii]
MDVEPLFEREQQTMDMVDLKEQATSSSRKMLRLKKGSSSAGESRSNRLPYYRPGKQPISLKGEFHAPLVTMTAFSTFGSSTHSLFHPLVLLDPLVEFCQCYRPTFYHLNSLSH